MNWRGRNAVLSPQLGIGGEAGAARRPAAFSKLCDGLQLRGGLDEVADSDSEEQGASAVQGDLRETKS